MTLSLKRFYEERADGMDEHYPCDTGDMWTIADNILHLVDESPCYRINWASPSFSTQTGALPATGITIPDGFGGYYAVINVVHQFPTTILYAGRYPNYDVRVAAKTTSGTVQLQATLATPDAPYTAGIEDPSVIGVANGSTSSTTGAWAIEARFSSASKRPAIVGNWTSTLEVLPNGSTEPVGRVPGFSAFARLQVVLYATGMASTGSISLVGLQVKEYPD